MGARRSLLRTSVLRLSVIYVIVFSLAASLLICLLYVYAVRAPERETDEIIGAELEGLVEQYQGGGLEALASIIGDRVRDGSGGGDVYLLADPGLHPVAGNIAVWPVPDKAASRWTDFEVSVTRGQGFEPRNVRAGLFTLPGGYRLLVGTDIHEREAFKAHIRWTLLASLLIVIAVGTVLGVWTNRQVIRRVNSISAAGREIVEGNFSRRLPHSDSGGEFDFLASNLNEMLDRVQDLTVALRFVIDSTAHDLRGPLNRMRARMETGLRSSEPVAARQALDEALKDADTLDRTLDSLLRIAQAQGGQASVEIAPLDLAELAAEMVELYEPVAGERQIVLRGSRLEPATVRASRQLLAQALANLIDNALKFTPAGGSVDVQVLRAAAGLQLVIADSGPGIPAADRARALGRFVRLEGPTQAPGSGLGLSLVAAVARMHRATLELGDNHPGLRVVLCFPDSALHGARSHGGSPARTAAATRA